MGYASYFEDIRDQIAENLENLKREIVQIESKTSSRDRFAFSLMHSIRTVEQRTGTLLKEINEFLELATQPGLDAEYELIQARKRNEQLEQRPTKSQLNELCKRNKELAQELVKVDKQLAAQRVKVEQATAELDLERKSRLKEREDLKRALREKVEQVTAELDLERKSRAKEKEEFKRMLKEREDHANKLRRELNVYKEISKEQFSKMLEGHVDPKTIGSSLN